MQNSRWAILTFLFWLAYPAPAATRVVFVNAQSNAGQKDGTTWARAYSDLRQALEATPKGTNDPVEFWIARGVYKPTASLDRSVSFQLRGWHDVLLIGGFTGVETESYQANPLNQTILSGDLGVIGSNLDNTRSVLTLLDNDFVSLQNLVIADGNASLQAITAATLETARAQYYAGIGVTQFDHSPIEIDWNAEAEPGRTEPSLERALADAYHSQANGGGIRNFRTQHLGLYKCVFQNNAAGYGGALFSKFSDVIYRDCVFTNNTAVHGGAACHFADQFRAQTSLFAANNAGGEGGAIYSLWSGEYAIQYNTGSGAAELVRDIAGSTAKNLVNQYIRAALIDDGKSIVYRTLNLEFTPAKVANPVKVLAVGLSITGTRYLNDYLKDHSEARWLTPVLDIALTVIDTLNKYTDFVGFAILGGEWLHNTFPATGGHDGIFGIFGPERQPTDEAIQHAQDEGIRLRGAVYNSDARSFIEDSVFTNNVAALGGAAVRLVHSNTKISRSAFTKNSTSATAGGLWGEDREMGGVIYASVYMDLIMENCLINENTSAMGFTGVINENNVIARIYNSTFRGNAATGSTNDFGTALCNVLNSESAVKSSIFWENTNHDPRNLVGGADFFNSDYDASATNGFIRTNFTAEAFNSTNRISNCAVQSLARLGTHNVLQGVPNLDADPLFFGAARLAPKSPIRRIGRIYDGRDEYEYVGKGVQSLMHFTTDIEGMPVLAGATPGCYQRVRPPERFYVNPAATGRQTGENWENAFTNFQAALDIEGVDNPETLKEIWVARGTYFPKTDSTDIRDGTGRDASFFNRGLVAVKIYGGFNGTETNLNQRVLGAATETILSGDIGVPGDNADNSKTVLRFHETTGMSLGDFLIDGFTIRDGNTDQDGLAAGANFAGEASPWVKNCKFANNNSTANIGGGGAITGAGLRIFNCVFSNNAAAQGGAIFAHDGLILLKSILDGNRANGSSSRQAFGGAAYVYSPADPVRAENCLFVNNVANGQAALGGAFYFEGLSGRLLNCTIAGNTINAAAGRLATGGAGVFQGPFNGFLSVENSILWNNRVLASGRAYSREQEQLDGSHLVLNANCIEGIGFDPLFRDPAGGDYRLAAVSPAIGAAVGLESLFTPENAGAPVVDLAGLPRIVGGTLDQGAYQIGPTGAAPLHISATPQPGCADGSFGYSVGTLAGLAHQWQVDTGNGIFANISDGLDYAGTLTPDFRILRAFAAKDHFRYRARISGAFGNIFSFPVVFQNPIIYVNAAATGNGSGANWQNACVDLPTALGLAMRLQGCREIWVARGTYYPTAGTDRAASFVLQSNLGIYGGFIGNETLKSQRNFAANQTILSGDIGARGNAADNSFHVIRNTVTPPPYATLPIDATAVLDGFTITAGTAVGPAGEAMRGGGIYNVGVSPAIQNCIFRYNTASEGGAFYAFLSQPSLINCAFETNTASRFGGAIQVSDSALILRASGFRGNASQTDGGAIWSFRSSVAINENRTVFENNTASGNGGAIYNERSIFTISAGAFAANHANTSGGGLYALDSTNNISLSTFSANSANFGGAFSFLRESALLDRCVLENNTATLDGGGLVSSGDLTLTTSRLRGNSAGRNGGGLSLASSASIRNSVIAENTASIGGGASVNAPGVRFINCTITRNQSALSPGGIQTFNNFISVINSILWNNRSALRAGQFAQVDAASADIKFSCVQGSPIPFGAGNINVNPLFVNPENNYQLSSYSPALNAGNTADLPAETLDAYGSPRQFGLIDMGANEFPTAPDGVIRIAASFEGETLNGASIINVDGATPGSVIWEVRRPGTGSFVTLIADATHKISGTTLSILEPPQSLSGAQYRYRIDGTTFISPAITLTVPPVTYVNPAAPASGNGASWATAFNNLQTALAAATGSAEIWVAAGTNYPTSTLDRTASFALKSKVSIYGGFAGIESTRGQRNPRGHISILSGDIGQRGNDSDNSRHIVYNDGLSQTIDETALLDGFTLVGGRAGESGVGGAILNVRASPTIHNCAFEDNTARSGGAIAAQTSSPLIQNCIFRNNTAGEGGAIYIADGSPRVVNSLFTGNHAAGLAGSYGGAMHISESSALILGCTFSGNTAAHSVAGLEIDNRSGDMARVVNSILWNNQGAQLEGSGFSVDHSTVQGSPVAPGTGNLNLNPLFEADFKLSPYSPLLNAGDGAATANFAADLAGHARIFGSAPDIGAYELQQAASAPVAITSAPEGQTLRGAGASLRVDGIPGSNIRWEVKLPGAANFSTVANGSVYSIENTSTSSVLTIAQPPSDLSGALFRYVVIDAGYLSASVPFIGAPVIYVNPRASSAGDGATWATAFRELQQALAATGGSAEIWVAWGTNYPSASGDRDASFSLKSGVALYGGFVGTETSRDQRDWRAHPSLLSGDIGLPGVTTDNSRHVIQNNGVYAAIDATAILDGFTVSGGHGDASNLDDGGGLLNVFANPIVRNCIFENNSARDGGAMKISSSSPTVIDTIIRNNSALAGAAISSYGGSPIYLRCLINGNTSTRGALFGFNSRAQILHCTVASNASASWPAPAGISSQSLDGSTMQISDSIIWENRSGATSDLNAQLNGAVLAVTHSIVQWDGANGANPLFIDPAAGDFHLDPYSPADGMGAFELLNPAGEQIQIYSGLNFALIDGGAISINGVAANRVVWEVRLAGASAWNAVANDATHSIAAAGANSTLTISQPPALYLNADYRFRVSGTTFASSPIHLLVSPPIFVNAAAAPGGNGATWPTAFQDLPAALSVAARGKEIWIAQGVYRPTAGTNRNAAFNLKSGIAIYGGFTGIETNRDQRDWRAHETLLSGDIGRPGEPSDNSRHVVLNDGTFGSIDATAILDGFTIADGHGDAFDDGGGMQNIFASPTIRNCLFRDNTARNGGALQNSSSSSLILNCVFRGNVAQAGGAIANFQGAPRIVNSLLIGNRSIGGSGQTGGAIYNSQSASEIINCTISGNAAPSFGQGGIYVTGFPAPLPRMVNSILWNNLAGLGNDRAAQINNASFTVENSCVQGAAVISGVGNINFNPLFEDGFHLSPHSPALNVGNSAAALSSDLEGHLRVAGGAVDMGAFEFQEAALATVRILSAPEAQPLQGQGTFQIVNGVAGANIQWQMKAPGAASFSPIDSGAAYSIANTASSSTLTILDATESLVGAQFRYLVIDANYFSVPATLAGLPIIYVRDSAPDGGDGASWATAFNDLQLALQAAGTNGQIWVAAGTYRPTATANRDTSFLLKSHIALYGGFAGTETNRDARNWAANETILSGDIGAPGVRSDNSKHVVYFNGVFVPIDSTAILDGFTIAYGYGENAESGGGLLTIHASATVRNCLFRDNLASNGGAVSINYDAPQFTNCQFIRNTALQEGGAVAVFLSEPRFAHCLIAQNISAGGSGGSGGAVALDNTSAVFESCTIAANRSPGFSNSRAISIINFSGLPPTRLSNSILWGNAGGGVTNASAQISPLGFTMDHSCAPGIAGTGNLNANPLFLNAPGGDFRLSPYSPAIDAGENGIDMGAFQFNGVKEAALQITSAPETQEIIRNGRLSVDYTPGSNVLWERKLPNSDFEILYGDAGHILTVTATNSTLQIVSPFIAPGTQYRYELLGTAFWVNVLQSNRPPAAASDSVSVAAGQTVRIPVLANDSDPDGDSFTLISAGPASSGDVRVIGGAAVYTSTGAATAADSFSYTIMDRQGATAVGTVSVAIYNTNLLVTTTADAGPGSLREALGLINSLPTSNTWRVNFAPALTGQTIQLSTIGDLSHAGASAFVLSNRAEINASAAPGLSIARAGAADAMRLFRVASNATITLRNLGVTGGLAIGASGLAGTGGGGGASGLGGAIFNEGALTLENIVLAGNEARGGAGGAYALRNPLLGGDGGGPDPGLAGGFVYNAGFASGGAGSSAASDVRRGIASFGGGSGGGVQFAAGGLVGTGGRPGGGGGGGYNAGGGGGMGGGGAIFNYGGAITILNSAITNNITRGGFGGAGATSDLNGFAGQGFGGAMLNWNGRAFLTNAILSNNSGDAGLTIYQISSGNETELFLSGINGTNGADKSAYRAISLNGANRLQGTNFAFNSFSAPWMQNVPPQVSRGPLTIELLYNLPAGDPNAQTVTAVVSGDGPLSNAHLAFTDPFISDDGLYHRTLTVTPPPGLTGTNTISLTRTDLGSTYTIAFSIELKENRPPILANDTATVFAGQSIQIPVLQNDFDPDGHSLTIISVASGQSGSAALGENGLITYTHNGGTATNDNFAYVVSDGLGGIAAATVAITILPNLPPLAINDTASIRIGESTTLPALANDSDPDGNAIAIIAVTQPAFGAAAFTANSVTYHHTGATLGNDSFTYTIRDERGALSEGTVFVQIQPNHPPVAANNSAALYRGQSVTIAPLENDSDADNDPLNITSVSNPGAGSVQRIGNTVIYTHNDQPAGSDSFSYTISDGQGGSASATVSLTILDLDLIVTSEADSGDGTLRAALAIVNSNPQSDVWRIRFADQLTGLPVRLSTVGNNLFGASALFVSNRVDIDFGGAVVSRESSAPSMRLFRIASGASLALRNAQLEGGSSTGFGGAIYNEGTLELKSITLTGNHAGGGGAIFSRNGTLHATGGIISSNAVIGGDGLGGAILTINSQSDFTGVDFLNNSAPEGGDLYQIGESAGSSLYLTNVNVVSSVALAANGGAAQTVNIDSLIASQTNPRLGPLTAQSARGPATIHFPINARNGALLEAHSSNPALLPDANLSISAAGTNGSLIITPPIGAVGSTILTLKVSEAGLSYSERFTLTLEPNRPPTAISTNIAIMRQQSVNIPVLANASDPDGNSLAILSISNPSEGSVSSSGGSILYTHTGAAPATENLTYTISDGRGGSATGSVTIAIFNEDMQVTSLADSGPGTLRAALDSANSFPTSLTWRLSFAPSLANQTILLATAASDSLGNSALVIRNHIEIESSSGVRIARNSSAPAMRLFRVETNASLTLRGLQLSGGLIRGSNGKSNSTGGGGGNAGLGGAILNEGALRLENCIITGNQALGGNGGAWLFNAPVASAANGLFAQGGEASAPAGIFGSPGLAGFGAGLGGGDPLVALAKGGSGGFGGGGGGGNSYGGGGGLGAGAAIFNRGGLLFIVNSSFTANAALGGSPGAGYRAYNPAQPGRAIGAAIFNLNGQATITGSSLLNNSGDLGGGIHNLGDGAAATLVLENTVLNNPAGGVNFVNETRGGGSAQIAADKNSLLSQNAPWVQDIPDQDIHGPVSIPFQVSLPTGAAPYLLEAHSSDQLLLPDSALSITGSGSARTLNISSAIGAVGFCVVTVQLTDGPIAYSDKFQLILEPNRPPEPFDDIASLRPLDSVTINPLANDSDPDGNLLQIISTTTPSLGSVTFTSTNITYRNLTPGAHDSFSYTVRDGRGGSATAVVNITIQLNHSPVATADSASINGGQSTTIQVLANDSDSDGDPIIITAVSSANAGTVSFTTNSVTYTHNGSAIAADSFTYTINDGHAGSATASVNIAINTNHSPVAAPDTVSLFIGQTVAIQVLANDSDPDGDSIAVTAVSQASAGAVSFTTTSVTYTHNGSTTASDSFTYTIRDSRGATATATVSVTAATLSLRVTNASDNGPGSLRAALAAANASPTTNKWSITLDAALSNQTIQLTTIGDQTFGPSALAILNRIEIEGSNAPNVAIARLPSADEMRLLRVATGAELSLKNIRLQNGIARGGAGAAGSGGGGGGAGFGGVIFNEGSLSLDGVVMTNNRALGGAGGSYAPTGIGGFGGGPLPGGFASGGSGSDASGSIGKGGVPGYGGGAGGGELTLEFGVGGAGGFGGGGGGGNASGGGGGLGAGGAIFNRGGTVNINRSTIQNNFIASGAAGAGYNVNYNGLPGSALGAALFSLNGQITGQPGLNRITDQAGTIVYFEAFVLGPDPSIHPTIGPANFLSDGRFHLRIQGQVGFPCTVQFSSDLSAWFEPINAVETSPGIFEFTDSTPLTARRFYKVSQ